MSVHLLYGIFDVKFGYFECEFLSVGNIFACSNKSRFKDMNDYTQSKYTIVVKGFIHICPYLKTVRNRATKYIAN